MALEFFCALMLACSVGPALLFLVNLRRYKQPRASTRHVPTVSVLIPARNEERNIGECLRSVLASRFVEMEVLVLDDGSTDRTAEIVTEIARTDPRLQLGRSTELPPGWNGKQHACWLLAQHSTAPVLLFLDADVRLEPEAISRCAAAMRRSRRRPALLSGFPRQIMTSWTERMLLPLIHFVLLGYLPMGKMRKTTRPSYAAGCGQFMLVKREAYFECGGHAAIRSTRHDGLQLPRLFRSRGFATDLADLTNLAKVRMYDSASAVWNGLAKNAGEGLGAPARIVPITFILFLGQVLPALLIAGVALGFAALRLTGGHVEVVDPNGALDLLGAIVIAAVASYLPRLVAVGRFKQPVGSALLHPLGVMMLLALQWYALGRQVLGKPVEWRARSYEAESGAEINGPAAKEADSLSALGNDKEQGHAADPS